MTSQVDFVGGHTPASPPPPFQDIRGTRPSVADEKAVLCLRLGALITKIPHRIKSGGSVNDVRAWRRDLASSKKVAANPKSSRQDLNSAISRMEKWL